MNYIYNYEKVKEFFGDDCFKMNDVRGAVIFETKDCFSNLNVGEEFKVGEYTLYCHSKNAKYTIGSFPC